jgi:hypothetical protein
MPQGNIGSTPKTNITAVETALNTAINSLSLSDPWQAGARRVLAQMRKQLDQIKIERSQ